MVIIRVITELLVIDTGTIGIIFMIILSLRKEMIILSLVLHLEMLLSMHVLLIIVWLIAHPSLLERCRACADCAVRWGS